MLQLFLKLFAFEHFLGDATYSLVDELLVLEALLLLHLPFHLLLLLEVGQVYSKVLCKDNCTLFSFKSSDCYCFSFLISKLVSARMALCCSLSALIAHIFCTKFSLFYLSTNIYCLFNKSSFSKNPFFSIRIRHFELDYFDSFFRF